KLVYERSDHALWQFAPEVSDDGRYLLFEVFTGDESKNLLFYQDLHTAQPRTIELIHELKAQFHYLGNNGSTFYILTTDGAPKGRIIAIDVANPGQANWKELAPER